MVGLIGKIIKVGFINTTINELTKEVLFPPGPIISNYQVFMQPLVNTTVNFWPTNLTVQGFTLNLSEGVNAAFSYLAVEVM